jgi:thioredoxin:protein disulfide reductase
VKRVVPFLLLFVPALALAAEPSSFDTLREKGWIWAYLGTFAAGFLTSLTPCVYPLIGITVAIFGAKEASSRFRAFLLAALYVLGMVVTYSTLGVVFALSGRMTGAGFLLASPYVVIPIVILYAVLSASMFGAFELNLPSSWQAKLSGVGGKGMKGAFLMGLVGGFIAAPCTGPMLAGLLAFVATTRSVGLGLSLMSTYALGMGVLFLVVATFAMSLPKSGAWMETVKAIGGISLLVVAGYFLRPIVPALARLTDPGIGFIAIVGGAVALGAVLLIVAAKVHSPIPKWAGIVLGVVGGIGVVNWTMTPKAELSWRHDREVALSDAKGKGRPALIDFSAEWCKPCKAFETEVLSDPVVHGELADRFVAVKFDVTEGNDVDLAHQESWNAAALPTVILLDSEGKVHRRFQGELPDADAFLAALRSVR